MKRRSSGKPRVFYGYWVVLVAFLSLFAMSGGGFYTFSLFVRPLEADLGWSRGDIMGAFTVFFLVVAAISPFIGRLVDRYGARQVIAIGALVTGLGFVALTQLKHLGQFYLGYAIIGIGLSAIGPIPTSAVVSNWFQKKRGLAIGLMSMGVGGGGFVLAPLVGGYLIPNFGWRVSYLVLALLIWVLIIPLALLVIKTKPADMGLYPDGMEVPEAVTLKPTSSAASGLTLKMALVTPAFWLIAISYLLNNFSHVGIIQTQVPHLQDIGFPVATAATALGTVGLASAIGKFGFGWLCDRIPPNYAGAIGLGLQVVGLSLLRSIEPTSPPAVVWLYAIMLGLGIGGWLPTMTMLTGRTFGLASYGAIFGGVSLFQSSGTAFGPLVAGHLYDIMGTYQWAFIIFLSSYAVSIPAVLLVRRPSAQRRQWHPAGEHRGKDDKNGDVKQQIT